MWAEHIPLLFFPFFLQRNLSRSSCPSTPFPALCLCFCVFFCFVKFVQTSRVGSTYRPASPPLFVPFFQSFPLSPPTSTPRRHCACLCRLCACSGIRLRCVSDVLQPQAHSAYRCSLPRTQHCCSRKDKYSSTKCSYEQNPNLRTEPC